METLGADVMTLDGSKIYGPKGVGILAKKENVEIQPVFFGGGQERGLRSGTEDVARALGFAEALKITQSMKKKESARLKSLRDYFIQEALKHFSDSSLNGDLKNRLPNNINVCFPGLDAEFAVIKLDHARVACSSVSACKTLSEDSLSYVIKSLGKLDCAGSSLRFSLGRGNTKKEIDKVVGLLKNII
jgi:cysteine desulfurase